MKRYLTYLMLALAILSSCSDEPTPDNKEDNNDNYLEFNLSEDGNESLGEITSKEIEIILSDPIERTTYSFLGTISYDSSAVALDKRGVYTCRLEMGDEMIPNGKYFVTIKGEDRTFGGRNLISLQNGTAHQVLFSQLDYSMLEGNGLPESPYLINDAADLMTFLYYLGEDEYHGYGLYFRQTGSFDCPRRSEIIDGRSWTSTYFQGFYDGDAHEIRNLAYIGGGNSADDNIGLFRGLFNATVKNLKISNAIVSGGGSNVGFLAGVSEGNTTISNVSYSGTLMAQGSNIGGLIGGVDGRLEATDISFSNLAVAGNENVGGIIGSFNGNKLVIDGVSSPNHIFTISGKTSAGGIAGYVETRENSKFLNITLEHSVDSESSDVKVISSEGENAGGIVGKMAACSGNYISNCNVKCPVYAEKNAGGLIGNMYFDGRFSIEKTLLASVVHAGECGGGFFGRLAMSGEEDDLVFTGDDRTIRYVVKNSAEAHVKGGSKLGAVAGSVTGRGGKIVFDSEVEIAVNVKGTNDHIGGGFGYMQDTRMKLKHLSFSSATMRVEGDGNIGGVIGYAKNCTIEGPNSIDINKKIPAAAELISSFGGVVVGKQDTGGIIGLSEGTLSGAYSTANVTSSTKAGGIAGRFVRELRECAFGGEVSAPDNVAGIVACANGEGSISHCVNLADIKGGYRQAGIIAEFRGFNSLNSAGLGTYCSTRIWYCANKGKLTEGKNVGGIVAYYFNRYCSEDIPLNYCVNYGDIKAAGSGAESVGGVAGGFRCEESIMSGCANHGNVSSSEVQKTIGGVVGFAGHDDIDNKVIIQQCMNSGQVSSDKSSTKIGGVVGHIGEAEIMHYNAIIRDCYNIGDIPSDQKNDTGGILGYASSRTNTYRTFNRGKVSHGNATIGTHASGSIFYHSHNYYLEGTGGSWPSSTSVKNADIAKESKYGDFDFKKIWIMSPSGPILRDCPFQ